MYNTFTFSDGIILFAYLIIVLSMGFYYSRVRDKNFNEYFLAGKNVGWFAIGFSIFATNISSEHFVGLAGSGSVRGLAVAQFELLAIFILILLGWILVPIYHRAGVVTMPEFLEKRFDAKSRKFFAGLSILIYLVTKISVTIFAGGILFYKIFGLSIYNSAIIIVLITGLYSVIGGASAVIRTHVFQGWLMILGAVTLTLFGLNEVGWYEGLRSKLPADYFTMFKPMTDPDFPWTGILFGAPIIAFWYWCTDQYIVQRLMCAGTIENARRGSLLAASLKILPLFILVLPGLIAAALFPEVSGDDAYPVLLASNILPAGVKGFVIAGLLAAVMSSMASVFNTTATLFVNDFYKPRHPEANERKLVLIGRLSATVIVVFAILGVPLVKLISSQMYLYLQSVQAFISPPITAVFIFGLLVKQTTSKAALWTLIIGEAIGVSRLIAQLLINTGVSNNSLLVFYTQINFLHFAIFLFLFSSVLIFSLSYLTKPVQQTVADKLQYLFAESFGEVRFNLIHMKNAAGYKSNMMLSAFLFLIILGLWGLLY